jgi:trehalose-phosphatase
MHHLFESWRQVSTRLRKAPRIALFLDFDGTLARLAARPWDVWLHPATRRVLLRLAHRPRVRIWVITGRSLADIRERIRIPGLHYLGLHGWEGKRDRKLSEQSQSFLRQALAELAPRIDGIAGLWIENKGVTFALHYRGAADLSVKEGRAALRTALEPFSRRLRVIEGDQVLEVLPRELAGKGVTARREWRAMRRAVPIYVGNDGTDEPAFVALARGVTVRVGGRCSSRAKFRLRNPAEVRSFLERLEAEIG